MPTGMVEHFFSGSRGIGEINTPIGRAIVEERYRALRRQVPAIYLLAVANLSGLELATSGSLHFGINFPTFFAIWAVLRSTQWLRTSTPVSHATMLSRLQQTCFLAAALCISVSAWCLYLMNHADGPGDMAVILFGGLTAVGTAYGLSALPLAARLPLFVLALPLAAAALASNDPQFVGAAVSLAVVAGLILRLLEAHNSHLTDLIKSRTRLVEEQEVAERARQQAVAAATTDFLTGLPNRRAFIAALDAEIAGTSGDFAVAILDLDNFKQINDTLGHPCGDRLLEEVAGRLKSLADAGIVAARMGGDEFGLLIRNVSRSSQARAAGARILEEVQKPAVINGRQVDVAASLGLGVARRDAARTPSRMLADADLALYEAKRGKGAHLAVFEARMEAPHQRRSTIERSLRLPNVHENIHLVFQPIVDLTSGRIVAAEALARWKDDELGNISPAEFVPIAEQLNIIGSISDHVMKEAFKEASQWPAHVGLALNLSAVQLCSPRAAETMLKALARAGLQSERLQVEVTETALLADFARARQNLAKLREAGATIVLDDFGAGYSSIGYLRQLTFDQIKIDGALIKAAQEGGDGKRLLAAVIGLCAALGVSTVAEHIENEEQHQLVTGLGCETGQGFWLSEPMSAAAMRDYLRAAEMVGHKQIRQGPRQFAA